MLIKEYDIKSKEIRAQLGPTLSENMLWIADSAPAHDGIIKDKDAKMLIREIDAQQHEKDCMQNKMPEYYEWIDIKARDSFHEEVSD